jgi:1-phosphatidylinositol phosphodiesterase
MRLRLGSNGVRMLNCAFQPHLAWRSGHCYNRPVRLAFSSSCNDVSQKSTLVMGPPPLTIRNLSSTNLELKVIERFETQVPKGFAHITRNVTHFVVSNTTGSSSAAGPEGPNFSPLTENAQGYGQQEVSLRIEPFTTNRTDINTAERSDRDVLRLTFEHDGQLYRVDTRTSRQSQELVPLSPEPRKQYTAIWIDRESTLAIYSSANMSCWMRQLADVTPLSALSIPGTHNSPTHHTALPSVRCQAVSPKEQLRNGVRFFDIRVQPEKPEDPNHDGLALVHGVFPISLTGAKPFRKLVGDIQDFLRENPSETLIMSLKREGPGEHTDEQLSTILKQHYANDNSLWFTEPRIPSLGEARGKIVLMRRFALAEPWTLEWDGRGWCLDAQNWAYNTACDKHGSVCVQDFCEVLETENIQKKIDFCCEHFERAGAQVCPVPGITTDAVNPVPPGPLYLNFLSASNFWKVGCWPEKIAAKLNPAVTEFLCLKHETTAEGGGDKGDGGVGIVVTDWVGKDGDWDLIRCIVGMNSLLELREKQ